MSETTSSLPTLKGTDKQIEWATDLRDAKLKEIETHLDGLVKQHGGNPAHADVLKSMANAVAAIKAEDSASYWIDNQRRSGQLLIRDKTGFKPQRA